MLKIKIDDSHIFETDFQNGTITVDGLSKSVDILKLGPRSFHLLIDHKSYFLEVREVDESGKVMTVQFNNQLHEVEVQDQFDQLLEKLGMDTGDASSEDELRAPMPGLVLEIIKQSGETVKKGDDLIILEAMKMENILKSPVDGKISSINCEQGGNVEKGEILFTFEL